MTKRPVSAAVARSNALLAVLSPSDLDELLPELEEVDLDLGESVYESGAKQNYLYFPTTAVISLLYVTEDGASTEIALAGREGPVGVALFMGGDSTPNRAVVQSAGKALRTRANIVRAASSSNAPICSWHSTNTLTVFCVRLRKPPCAIPFTRPGRGWRADYFRPATGCVRMTLRSRRCF